ncbi:MAG: class D sortase [Anaerolineaceae bacterium]|nr:class D sortase [Anaerolineaceae bacterium]
MVKNRSAEHLSEKELQNLLIEKRRQQRQERLDQFRKTGRIIEVNTSASFSIADEKSDNTTPEHKKSGKTFFDGLLFLIEVLAVAGLIFIVYTGFNVLQNLNQEVATVLEQPTLSPTPLIMAVVLPSGHTPPNAPGGVQFNWDEIPEHLQPLVQSLADLPIPTPSPEQAVRIQIPDISVDAPVVQGDRDEQLKKGVGQTIGTPNPGQNGNIVLSAHNDVFGEIFRNLDRLVPGNEITIFTSQKSYRYVIQEIKFVEPSFVEVMANTQEPVVTLISCYPYMVDNQRIIVRAVLQN